MNINCWWYEFQHNGCWRRCGSQAGGNKLQRIDLTYTFSYPCRTAQDSVYQHFIHKCFLSLFVLYVQEYILSLDQSEWNCCLGSPLSNQFPNTKIFAVGDYRNSASIVQLCTSSVRTVRNWSNFVLGEFGRPSHGQYVCAEISPIVGQNPDDQIQKNTPSFHGWGQ